MSRMSHDLGVFASASVGADVEITLHRPRQSDDESVSILFGSERIMLEFYDVESLERLSDLAREGAGHLRTVIEANAQSDVAESNSPAAAPRARPQ